MKNLIEKIEIRRELKASELPKHPQEAKGQAPQSGMLMLRDLLLGGFMGGLAGAALGRWSLLGGALTTGAAYYAGMPGLAGFGIGMTAAGMNAKSENQTVGGTDKPNQIQEAKARMKSFVEGFKQKLWLDKLKKEAPPVEIPPSKPVEGLAGSDDPLAEIESQLITEAINYQREEGLTASDFAGPDSHLEQEEEFDPVPEEEPWEDQDPEDFPDEDFGDFELSNLEQDPPLFGDLDESGFSFEMPPDLSLI